VLRDDEDRGLGRTLPQRQRRAHTLVAEARRQSHVDDRDVRPFEEHARDEGVAVRDGGDDVEPVVAEEAREAVAEECEVLCDHDPPGIPARTVVGPPGGLVTSRLPSSACTRLTSPRSPLPSGFAPPSPSSTTATTSLPSSSCMSMSTDSACACLPVFASASAT